MDHRRVEVDELRPRLAVGRVLDARQQAWPCQQRVGHVSPHHSQYRPTAKIYCESRRQATGLMHPRRLFSGNDIRHRKLGIADATILAAAWSRAFSTGVTRIFVQLQTLRGSSVEAS